MKERKSLWVIACLPEHKSQERSLVQPQALFDQGRSKENEQRSKGQGLRETSDGGSEKIPEPAA